MDLNTLPKIKTFLWLCSHNKIPSNAHIYHLGLLTNANCAICNDEIENLTHILFDFPWLRKLWLDMGLNMNNLINTSAHWLSIINNIKILLWNSSVSWRVFLPILIMEYMNL